MPTTCDCVHSITHGHFRLRDKDDDHQPIHRSRKRYDTRKPLASSFDRTGVLIGDRRFTVYIARIRIFNFFAPVTSTLTRWLSYTNLTRIPWRCTVCAIRNFLC